MKYFLITLYVYLQDSKHSRPTSLEAPSCVAPSLFSEL